MQTILFLAAAGVLALLGRIGFIIYETLQMDFDFNRPWDDDHSSPKQVPEAKETTVTPVQQEAAETEESPSVSLAW